MKFRNKLTSGKYYQEILIIIMITFLFGLSCKAQTKQELIDYMEMLGVKHKKIVLKQIMLEN